MGMWIVLDVLESIGLILGSLLVATFLCLAVWHFLVRLRHPELGPFVLVAVGVAALFLNPPGAFLRMVVAFTIAGALPVAIQGFSWRADKRHGPPRNG